MRNLEIEVIFGKRVCNETLKSSLHRTFTKNCMAATARLSLAAIARLIRFLLSLYPVPMLFFTLTTFNIQFL